MFSRSVAIVIACPQERVFPFVADARNRPSWDDSVVSEEMTSPEPIGVGTTVRSKFRSMGRDYKYTWEVVEHVPPHRMTIESTSGMFPTTLAYVLEGRGDETMVRFSVTGRPTGLLKLFEPMIARTTQKSLDQSFARLKQLLESGDAGPRT